MAGCELITLVTAVACGITKCYSEDDIAIMAAIFTQLGDSLATYLVQVELEANRAEKLRNIDNKRKQELQDKRLCKDVAE